MGLIFPELKYDSQLSSCRGMTALPCFDKPEERDNKEHQVRIYFFAHTCAANRTFLLHSEKNQGEFTEAE